MVQPTEAEFIKYTANALLATLISFSNEVFNLCEAVGGVNGCTVLTGVLMDHRWTPRVDGRLVRPVIQSYVMGGVGYGGSCLPKDLSAITTMARDCGWKVPLLEAVAEVNRARPSMVVNRLKHEAGDLRDRKVAVLGMAFKPGTDDWRNSPSLPLIQDLLEEGSRVVVWDPLVEGESVAQWEGRVLLVRRADEALKNANIALVATAWPEIARWPWMDLIACMAQAVIYDGRNLLTDFRWPAGVRYIPAGAGRGDGEVR
jgi:UDPglucose 6-dehydrogenase/GDP-mannose 6-dehydrogenase